MVIKYRFKLYPHIVCDDNKTLWQLEHFKNKRTYPKKVLTYNPDRKAFRIYSQWVSRNRLIGLKYSVYEEIKEDSGLLVSLKRLSKTWNNPFYSFIEEC